MRQIRLLLPTATFAGALILWASLPAAYGQTTPSAASKPADAKTASTKLSFRAALVLTPEFCATKVQPKGSWATKEMGTYDVGKAACEELEPALKEVFSNLTRVGAVPSSAEGEVVLVPRLVDVDATKAAMAFSNREMIVLLEWTVKDASGKTVWIETVQGTAKHHIGNVFTHGKNERLIVKDSVKDAAEQSAGKMSSSPELRKLASKDSGSAADRN